MSIVFAVSDVVWQALIAGVVTIVLSLIAERARRQAAEAARLAAIAAVKVDRIQASVTAASERQDAKADVLAEKVEVLHKATNGLVSKLMASTDEAAHGRGVADERARTEAKGP